MTKVIFETASVADAIKKADQVAPGRGQAFDKASGIVIEVTPDDPIPVVIRATNLDVFHMEWVGVESVTGEAVTWRIPSKILAQVIASLPIGTGKTVTFEQKAAEHYPYVLVTSGRVKARFNLMDVSYYPLWDAFDPDELVPVNNLGGRIAQVEWAAEKTSLPLCGVYLDGEYALATDKYKLARAPLKVPLGDRNGIIVPSGILGQILKQTGEVKMGVTSNQVLLMPDEYTQVRAVIYDAEYPGTGRITGREYPTSVKVKKAELLEVINRATVFAGSDRLPTLRLFVGKEEIAAMMANAEVGHLGDVLEVPGQCEHERVEIKFTPKNITEAINNAPNADIEIKYDPDKPGQLIQIDGGSGYQAWVMPRRAEGVSN